MAEMNRFEKAWATAVLRVWKECDEDFRRKLVKDPRAVFAELGAEIPAGVHVKIIENTPTHLHFVIPPKPEDLDAITDENLDELYRACPGTVCAVGGN